MVNLADLTQQCPSFSTARLCLKFQTTLHLHNHPCPSSSRSLANLARSWYVVVVVVVVLVVVVGANDLRA